MSIEALLLNHNVLWKVSLQVVENRNNSLDEKEEGYVETFLLCAHYGSSVIVFQILTEE